MKFNFFGQQVMFTKKELIQYTAMVSFFLLFSYYLLYHAPLG